MIRSTALTRGCGTGLISLAALCASSAQASPGDAFVQIAGIPGGSRAPGHQGWIEAHDVVVLQEGDVVRPLVQGSVYNAMGGGIANAAVQQPPPSRNPTSAPPGRAPGTADRTALFNSPATQPPPQALTNTGGRIISLVKSVDAVSPMLQQALSSQRPLGAIVIDYAPGGIGALVAPAASGARRIAVTNGVVIAIRAAPAGRVPGETVLIRCDGVRELP
jgi:hypothetical protein